MSFSTQGAALESACKAYQYREQVKAETAALAEIEKLPVGSEEWKAAVKKYSGMISGELYDRLREGPKNLRVRKVYTFGKWQDATVTTYFGTDKCKVVRHDPVGTYPSVVEWKDNYNEAHGVAKLHALTMNAKYN